VSNGAGLTLALTLTPGQWHKVPVYDTEGSPSAQPKRPTSDKTRARSGRQGLPTIDRSLSVCGGAIFDPCSRLALAGTWTRAARERSIRTYRRRNLIERCVVWLKGYRSIVTRHEKLAVNLAAMVKLAFMGHYPRTIRLSDRISL
jgi:transposase